MTALSRDEVNSIAAICNGDADDLPDCHNHAGSNLIESRMKEEYKYMDLSNDYLLYRGALIALSILGANETASLSEISYLARELINECRYNLDE
jgi:hypothetical protein